MTRYAANTGAGQAELHKPLKQPMSRPSGNIDGPWLAIKAILEVAKSGIWTLEQLLQSFTLLPNDQTVREWLEPQINKAYLSGKMHVSADVGA